MSGRPRRAFALACALITAMTAAMTTAAIAPVYADWPETGRLPVRQFTDRDGLPQNAVTAMTFAADGALWIGTKDGAARFNGRVWTTVPMPKAVTSNWITSIVSASDGALWFGTRGGGIARRTGETWTLFSTREGLPADEIICLAESEILGGKRTVFVGTDKGLARFDGSRFVPVALPQMNVPQRVAAIFEQKAGELEGLWIGLDDAVGRLRRDGTFTLKEFGSGATSVPVHSFAVAKVFDGPPRLFAISRPGILHDFLDGEWTIRTIEVFTGAPQHLLTTRERDGRDTLWIAGQARLAKIENGRAVQYSPRGGFPDHGIWSITETPANAGERALWVGLSGGGVARLQHDGWTAFDSSAWFKDSSVYSFAESLEADGTSSIYVGTNGGGLMRLDENGVAHPTDTNRISILSLLETREAAGQPILWVGTGAGVVVRRNGAWVTPDMPTGRHAPTTVLYAVDDTHGGEPDVLAGGHEGLSRSEAGVFRSVQEEYEVPDQRVNALLETVRQGSRTLWIGTERGLARRVNGATRTLFTTDGLPSDAILSLKETMLLGRRVLLVGTRGGFARLDLDDPSAPVLVYNTETLPGLPNNTIYRIEEDRRGRLYLCTNKGVARLTPRPPSEAALGTFGIYVYTTQDGLPSAECNTGASLVDSKGRIWVGTIGGAAVLDPEDDEDARAKPIAIERAVLSRTGAPLLADVSLGYDEGNVTFDYVLMNLFRDEDTRYRTQLVGLDEVPSGWTADAKKEYTSLPEGRYRFRVWARDVRGAVSGPLEWPFSVKPAPWRTWWAFAAYTLLAAGFVSLGMRFRLRAIRRRNDELEALVSSRTHELGDAVARLKESESQALQAKDAAVDASRAKSRFLANMSHELRTPLNAVIGFAQVLSRRDTFKGEDRESLRTIQRSGEHLLSLINDVLSLSKIEAGGMTLQPNPFDLRSLIESVKSIIAPRMDPKQLALRVQLDPSLPAMVMGDEGKLRQVLINLMSNAVKFTAKGHVLLEVKWNAGRAFFKVEDTGHGISEAELGDLFGAFVQTESGRASKEGTGLGLAISRQIVLLMGGDITASSTVGVGTTFTFDVDLPVTEMRDTKPSAQVVRLKNAVPPPRVLIVDDIAENRVVLRQLLVAVGFDVREAANAVTAIETWSSWRPALIFMDVRMAGFDGRQATRQIREIERAETRPRTAIVALTAGAFEHDREEMLAAGADDFVSKPFRSDALFEMIARRLGVEYEYEGESERPAGSDGVPTKQQMARIGSAERAALYDALASGDVRAAREAAHTIALAEPELGRAVLAQIQAFQLDELMSLLESVDSPN